MINEFAAELRKRVQERDPFAQIKVMKTPETFVTGEYLAVIESKGNVEIYAFNPSTKQWIACYQV